MPNEEIKIRNVEHALHQTTVLFMRHGIEGTTKEMIVRASGLSRKSVDRYFADKRDCALQVARWVGINIWTYINGHYPSVWFTNGEHLGIEILEMYLRDLKEIFMKEPELFVFYTEFKIFFSRNSDNYEKDYTKLLDTIGCRRLVEKIYRLGIRDRSIKKPIEPEEEAEYFCRAYFGFLSNMALTYKYQPEKTEREIDRYIDSIIYLYTLDE
jgi:AcrR family transcriptional regulator